MAFLHGEDSDVLRETMGHLRDLPRYSQIAGVLFHYGYQDILVKLNLEGLARPLEWVSRTEALPPERHIRVRMLCEDLGPTFVKLGQLLSTRPDLLPDPYIQELARLRDDVGPFPFEEVRDILEEELGKPLAELFAEIDEVALAAASISQVHRAKLHDGREIALKVRRPGIEKIVQADLDILTHLAELAEKRLGFLKPYRPMLLVREFERSLLRELDLGIERRTMERCLSQFLNDRDAHIPVAYRDFSTTRVLAMELIGGIRVDEIDALQAEGLQPVKIAARGARILLKQIFRYGLFHADPHPGNIRVLSDGKIALLDYGLFGHLDLLTREHIADLLSGLIAQETDLVLRALDDLDIRGDSPDFAALRRDVSELVSEYAELSFDNIDLKPLLTELIGIIRNHQLRLPPDLVLLIRSLLTIESVGRALDPHFDIAAHLRPELRRLTVQRFSVRRLVSQAGRVGEDVRRIAMLLPDVLSQTLESIRRGEFTLKFDLQSFESLVQQLIRASNVLAGGIVLAGLLVASSMLVRSDLRTLGYIGLTIALVLGGWLIWYMFVRKQK